MKKACLFLLLLVAFVAGCSKFEAEESGSQSFTVVTLPEEYSALQFDSEVLAQTITFIATKPWEILLSEQTKSSPDWIEVSPMSGEAGTVTLSIVLSENMGVEERSASIIIISNGEESEITLTQEAFTPILSLSSASESVTSVAGTLSIDVTSNIDWEVSGAPSWLAVSAESGSGNEALTFIYGANEATESRSATVKLSNATYSKEVEFTLTQEAFTPILSLSSASESVTSVAGTLSIDVTSNIDWEVSGAPSWLAVSAESGSGNEALTFIYGANEATESRSATVKLSNATYSKEVEFTLTQEAFTPILSLSSASESVTSVAGTLSIDVTSNIDWEVSGAPSWLAVSAESGSGNEALTFIYGANEATESRSATVKLSNATYSKEVEFTLTQEAFTPILSLSSASESVTSVAGTLSIDVTSNIDWEVSGAPSWLAVSAESGSGNEALTFIYGANEATEIRSATVKLSNATYSKEVEFTLTQEAFTPTLSLSSASASTTCDAGTLSIDVTSNTDWSITNTSSWITLSQSQGSGDQSITITYDANKTYNERVGTLSIAIDGTVQEFTLTQAGEVFVATLSVNPANKSVAKESGSFTINVISNTEWTISNSLSWVALSQTSGSGNVSVTVSYEANTTYVSRSGSFDVLVDGITQSVTIEQESEIFVPTLSLDKESISIDEAAGTFTIAVTSNTDWTTSGTPTWLTLSPSQGNGDQIITASYTANASIDSRVATITFAVDGITYSLTVSQSGDLSIEPTDPDIKDWESGEADDGGISTNVNNN